MRRFVAAVAVTGSALAACSSSIPEAFEPEPSPAGDAIAARVLADDGAFIPADAQRPRFVPCQGLSGCARTSPASGDSYPGVVLPSGVDDEIDFSQEVVLYLVGASFVEASFDRGTAHVRVRPRDRGFQMVKLDGREMLSTPAPTFSFEDAGGRVICASSWEGCG